VAEALRNSPTNNIQPNNAKTKARFLRYAEAGFFAVVTVCGKTHLLKDFSKNCRFFER